MFSHFDLQTKQILIGNILLIFCCVFYLAWWILAFKPTGAVKGMKSGWLLLPAVVFGVIVYIVMLAATRLILNRQVTTELFLMENEERFVILTTGANESMSVGHDRMPLVLEETQLTDWILDDSSTEKLLCQVPGDLKRQADFEQMTLFAD